MTNHPRRARDQQAGLETEERVPSTIVLAYDIRRAFFAIEQERKLDDGLTVEKTWSFGSLRGNLNGVRPNQIIIEKSFFDRSDWIKVWQLVRQRAKTGRWELPFLPEQDQDAVYTDSS